MTDYLNIRMTVQEINAVSTLGLAHIGDCVYELLVRSYIICHGIQTSHGLHSATVRYVKASAQANAMEKILPLLTEEEISVYRRGLNTRVHSVPKGAELSEYHAATGLECLFGWLYLNASHQRINELFSVIMENENDAT